MQVFTFKGGIHPPERKEMTENLAIETVFPSSNTVYIPVTQGGAPNQPIVSVGDMVKRGQIIARSDAFMSAPVHASISGKVKKIESRIVTGNVEALCVVIESDGSYQTDFMNILDPFACPKDQAIERVKLAGIVGMGGAAFPTHVKLNVPQGKKIDYFLANAAECEPYLTIDDRTLTETSDLVIDGLSIAMHITNAPKGIVVLEDNKLHLVPIIQKSIDKIGLSKKISITLVKTKYPQGGEKNLVQAAVKREIPVGGLPADAGCVIDNVGTLVAISEAFRQGKPLIDRGLTVSGRACTNPKNIKVPVGTLVGDLIPEFITLTPGVQKILSGGPMMGISMMSSNFPIQKNTSGVLFLTESEVSFSKEDPCINCGRCVSVCPCRLTPVLMAKSLQVSNMKDALYYGLMDCVECGCCSYVCPAHIQLVQRFRVGKQLYRTELMKKKAQQNAVGGK